MLKPLCHNGKIVEFLDEPEQPHYTHDDVAAVDPSIMRIWQKQSIGDPADYYFCVAYGELCAYPHGKSNEDGFVWSNSMQKWLPL